MAQGGGRGWVRVIAGTWRGLRLATLSGLEVRPTSDRVRESLFGILGRRVEGAGVVDCFAGTGALGIEALSRGARWAQFVEQDPRALAILRENVGRLREAPEVSIVRADALRPREWAREAFPADLIFADPPYRRGLGESFLAALAGAGVLAPGGLVLIEHEHGILPAHEAWTAVDRRRYGETAVTIYAPRDAAGDEGRA